MVMPLREYYSVARAAELLGCKVEDLLHWASIGAIKLYIEFDEGNGYVKFRDNSDEIQYMHSIYPVNDGPCYVHHIYCNDNKKTQDFFKEKLEKPLEEFLPCLFKGLWALPYEFFGYSQLYEVSPSLDILWLSPNSKMLICFESDEYITPKIDGIYLMKSDFIKLSIKKSKKSEDGDEVIELPNYYNGGIERPELKRFGATKKEHMTEFHAQKRESVLKAAIYMMCNHSELCENNIKWAEAINEYAHKFWEDAKMPLSVEKVAEIIGKAKRSLK
ncbi:MAG: hypothetical protein E6325_25625 [Enterobacteriaceae bacterium]|nr:hypothetical protein [Enterobacteriaceae bacterium]